MNDLEEITLVLTADEVMYLDELCEIWSVNREKFIVNHICKEILACKYEDYMEHERTKLYKRLSRQDELRFEYFKRKSGFRIVK